MAERKISTRVEITGEEKYKQSIKDINATLKLYNSELSNLKAKNKDAQNSYDYLRQKGELLNKVQEEQKNKTQEVRKALDNAKKAFADYAEKTDEAAKAVDEQQDKLDELEKTVGKTSAEYQEAEKALEKYKEDLNNAKAAQETCGKAVEGWKTKLNTAETQQNKTNEEIRKNSQYLKEAEQSADRCATSIDEYGKKQKAAAEKVEDSNEALKDSGDALDLLTNTVIASGATKAFSEIKEAIMECVDAATEYESSLAKLQTISGAASINELSADIQELSDATGIAASDLANTAYNAISAGTAVSEAVSMAESASKLAIAGFTDTDSALSVLTTAINAYGDSAGTATEISDSLIQVQNLGVTTVADLAANMGRAIATASAYSVNLSNLEAAYISTTKSGINTAESTTYISSMFKELGDAGTDVAKIVQEKTGMSFGKLMKSGTSLGDVLQILLDSCNGDAEALMNLWSSAEAGKASNAILNQGIETFNANLKTVQTSAGATETAYQTMADTTEMAGQRASNAFKNLKAAIGEELTPVLTNAQGSFAEMTEKVTTFAKEHPEVVKAIAAVATAMGIMAGGIVAVNVATNVLIPLFQALNVTMMKNPISLVVTAVAALVAALALLATNTESADNALSDYVSAADSAKSATNSLKDSFDEASQTFEETAGKAAATSTQAGELIERLEALSKKSNKTNEDISEMSALVAQLNELYPELGLELNTTTGELSKTNAELERFAENAKNTAMATAYQEKLADQTEAVVDAQTKLTAAQESQKKAGEEYAELQERQAELFEKQAAAVNSEKAAQEKYTATLNDSKATQKEIETAYQEYIAAQNESALATQELSDWQNQNIDVLNGCVTAQEDANAAIEEANEALEEAQDTVDETAEAYDDYQFKLTDVGDACQETFDKTIELMDAMDQSSESYEQVKADLQALTEEHLNFQASTQETYDSLKAKLEETQSAYDEATESIKSNLESQVGGLEAANMEIELSAQQIAENLQSQIDYLASYASNVQTITTTTGIQMTEEFLSFLNSGSEEAIQVAAAMNQAIAEGNTGAAQAVIDNYTGVQTSLESTSRSLADATGSYTATIDQLQTDLDTCVESMNQEDKAYQNTLYTMQGAIKAVNAKKEDYKSTYQTASEGAVSKLSKYSTAFRYGANNVQGAISGAQSKANAYVKVYEDMANAAIAAMQKVDQQHSPSKRYAKHGRFNVEGAILGVKELSGDYVKAYSSMASDAIEAYNQQMNELKPMSVEAENNLLNATGSIDVNVKDSTTEAFNNVGAVISGNNKSLSGKIDSVIGILQRYLPEAGQTYLDGDLVTKKITNRQSATSKFQSVIVGAKG